MRKIREVLQLSQGRGLSRRHVARAAGVPPTTAADYLGRIAAYGLSWPLADGMDAAGLERQLFTRGDFPSPHSRPIPDRAAVHRELRRPSVTLPLLWMEHKERYPDGPQYTRFVHHHREWARHFDVVTAFSAAHRGAWDRYRKGHLWRRSRAFAIGRLSRRR